MQMSLLPEKELVMSLIDKGLWQIHKKNLKVLLCNKNQSKTLNILIHKIIKFLKISHLFGIQYNWPTEGNEN